MIISRNRWSVSCFWVRHEKKKKCLSWKDSMFSDNRADCVQSSKLHMILVRSSVQSWATTTRSDVTVLERTETVEQAWCFGYTWQRNLKFSSPKIAIPRKQQTLDACGEVGGGGTVPLLFTTDVAAEDGSCGAWPWSVIGVIIGSVKKKSIHSSHDKQTQSLISLVFFGTPRKEKRFSLLKRFNFLRQQGTFRSEN